MRYLIIALLLGCASTYENTRTLEGEYWHYNVVVTETFGYQCIERTVTLRAKPALNPSHVVTHVYAVDRGCDETIDFIRFRNVRDRDKNDWRLRQDIMNALLHVRFHAEEET